MFYTLYILKFMWFDIIAPKCKAFTRANSVYISCQISGWIMTAHQPHQQAREPQQNFNYFIEFIKMTGN